MKTAREIVLEHIIERLLDVGRALCRVSVAQSSDLKPYQIGNLIEEFNQIELKARAKLLAPNDTTQI